MAEPTVSSMLVEVRKSIDGQGKALRQAIDGVKDEVHALALRVAEDIAGLRVEHDFLSRISAGLDAAGVTRQRLATLEVRHEGLVKAVSVGAVVVVGQWAAIIALWRALP